MDGSLELEPLGEFGRCDTASLGQDATLPSDASMQSNLVAGFAGVHKMVLLPEAIAGRDTYNYEFNLDNPQGTAMPLPAPAFLLGRGLIGLIGFAHRRTTWFYVNPRLSSGVSLPRICSYIGTCSLASAVLVIHNAVLVTR